MVWANENATGLHGLHPIPVVLLGRAGGRLRRTGRLLELAAVTHKRLGTSVMNLMGIDAEGFGDAPACGPLPDLV